MFTAGPFTGMTFGDVRRNHREFLFSLMNRSAAEVVGFLEYIVYCIRKMREN